jgi:Regulator of chromosome condensation (RCC1) repeat
VVVLVAMLVALAPAGAQARTLHLGNFLSPDRQVWCLPGSGYCATAFPARAAGVSRTGAVWLCNPTIPSQGCPQNWDRRAPILHYGDRSVVGGRRCVSARNGITCTVTASDGRRKGFVIGARRIEAVGTVGAVATAQTPLGFPEEEARAAARAAAPTVPVSWSYREHSCTVVTGARVRCWGADQFGQVGDGNAATAFPTSTGPFEPYVASPVEVLGLEGVTAVANGGFHSCALLAGGHVACWGYGAEGELGNGTRSDSATPVAVRGITNAVAISAGGEHTCALVADGTVACWGENADGELGDGSRTIRVTPVAVRGVIGATAISAGAYQTCALLAGGGASCWGRGTDGELGSGTKRTSAVPVAVQGLSGATAIGVGALSACALVTSGNVTCWGNGVYGNLGAGGRPEATTPVAVSGLTGATQISVGGYHACALVASGVQCWGRGVDGQMGWGKKFGSLTPVAVPGVSGVSTLSAGDQFSCATLADGAVTCWGDGNLSPVALRGLPAAAPTGPAVPAPVFGATADAQPVSGTVLVRTPGTTAFVPLSATTALPVGTEIDTTNGRVRLITARGDGGRTQSGLFYGGIFKVSQARARVAGRRVGVTVLTLTGALPACGAGRAATTDKKKPPRLVWGSAKGNYTTKGRYGSATVRGTKWLVQDSCAGTRVTVASGVVSVTDFVRHRTVVVRAPHSVLLPPRR